MGTEEQWDSQWDSCALSELAARGEEGVRCAPPDAREESLLGTSARLRQTRRLELQQGRWLVRGLTGARLEVGGTARVKTGGLGPRQPRRVEGAGCGAVFLSVRAVGHEINLVGQEAFLSEIF